MFRESESTKSQGDYINPTDLVTGIKRKILEMLEIVSIKDQTRVNAKKKKKLSVRRYRM